MKCPKKPEKQQLSFGLKREICLFKTKNPKQTLVQLRKHFSVANNIEIPISTLSDIIRQSSSILNSTLDNGRVRARGAKYPELEECLFVWQCELLNKHVAVSDDILLNKARDFGTLLAVVDFNFSRGWLQRYKDRFNISCRRICGESGGIDQDLINKLRKELLLVVLVYAAHNVFNLDETAFFYKLQPNKTLASTAVNG